MELKTLRNESQSAEPSITARDEPAVLVKNACKHYGFTKDPLVVLDGLNMTVPKGTIYGLLGASGCGKTTLLSCILGQKKLNFGEIQVLGKAQGTKKTFCGTQVGYMPQETGLYGDFTIEETLLYFGWITGMNRNEIKEKAETLMKTFLIPKTRQRVKTLSGGEQRRVSLISALLHDPQLLILDEPTVGVDPLLRENIWSYLKCLVIEKDVTVIITTHYIEETRHADIAALMRGGKLLAEECPEKLLLQHESQSLEEVFLRLSVEQNADSDALNTTASNSNQRGCILSTEDKCSCCLPIKLNIGISDFIPNIKADHMKALIWKNTLWWIRNLPIFIYTVMLSAAVLVVFCFSIGPDPHDLPLAVINYETNNSANCDYVLTCGSTQLSCNYLERLKNRSFILKYYNSEEKARASILRGELYGYVVVPHNYSTALRSRLHDGMYSPPEDIHFSIIDVIQENSDFVISQHLKRTFYEEFQYFIKEYFKACNENPKVLDLPLNWKKPIYGSNDLNYFNYSLPGMLIAFTFLQAVFLTAGTMLVERKEASLGRTFALGVTEVELLLGHLICEFVVMVIQSVLMVIVACVIFDASQQGSIVLVSLLVVLTGFCGMCYGLLISSICDSQLMISLAAVGTFLPAFYFCGVNWPIEGMHKLLRPFTPFHPVTIPIIGLRNILYKNWGLLDGDMYVSFVSLGAWSAFLLIASVIWLKINK